MSKSDDPDLFNLLGENFNLRNTEDLIRDEKFKRDIFVDEAEHDEESQMHPVLFRILSLGVLVIAIVGMGALAYGLWGRKPDVAPQMMVTMLDRESSEAEKEQDIIKKTINDLKVLVEGYLAATTVEEKLKYVRQPERVEPLMRDWYEAKKHPMVAKEMDSRMTLVPKTLFTKSFWKAEMNHGGMFKKQLWIQSYEDGTFGIDWETDVVYNPMHWDEFLSKKPQESMSFRVYVGWNDLYLYQHRDEEKFQSFKLESRDSDQIASAYMDRNDKGVKTMMFFIRRSAKDPKNLNTAVTLPFLVTLKYDESPEGKKNLVIEKLDSPSWIIFKKEEK